MNKIRKEQQQIAFRCFVRDTQKLICALQSGKSLEDLSKNCEAVCGHTCTDGYESEICNMNRWIKLLQKAEEKELVKTHNLIKFLNFIICDKINPFLIATLKKAFLACTTFQDFSVAKSHITQELANGSTIFNLILQVEDDLDDHDSAYLYNWLQILKEADEQDIIPGGSVRDFLNFIL